jgi:SMC interacting uncharacterized protein involved in chromosome segregation
MLENKIQRERELKRVFEKEVGNLKMQVTDLKKENMNLIRRAEQL